MHHQVMLRPSALCPPSRSPGSRAEEGHVLQPRPIPEDLCAARQAQHLPLPAPSRPGEEVRRGLQHHQPRVATGGGCSLVAIRALHNLWHCVGMSPASHAQFRCIIITQLLLNHLVSVVRACKTICRSRRFLPRLYQSVSVLHCSEI